MLVGEEFAGAAIARLDFIENQERPVILQTFTRKRMNSGVGSWMPETPCIPSIMTAANSSEDNALRVASISLIGTKTTLSVLLNGA